MFLRKMICQCGFGTKRLGKKDGWDLQVDVHFQGKICRRFVFHTPRPTINMRCVGEKGKNGKVPWWHPPESGSRHTGWAIIFRRRRLNSLSNGGEFFNQRHFAAADGKTEIYIIQVAGFDDRACKDVFQDCRYMQGAVTFAWTGINVDSVQFKMHDIKNDRAQDGTIHLWQVL